MFNGLPECAKGCMDGVVPGATAWPPRQSERRQLPKIRVPQSNWYFDPVPVVMFTTDGSGTNQRLVHLMLACGTAREAARRSAFARPIRGRTDGWSTFSVQDTWKKSNSQGKKSKGSFGGCCQRFGVLRVTVVTTQR